MQDKYACAWVVYTHEVVDEDSYQLYDAHCLDVPEGRSLAKLWMRTTATADGHVHIGQTPWKSSGCKSN